MSSTLYQLSAISRQLLLAADCTADCLLLLAR